jgi:DnaJ-domain-containing protein 1
MNSHSSVSHSEIRETVIPAGKRGPSWGAVFAGAVTALAVHFLLLMLGTATGLAAAEPTDSENPIANFGIGTAIVWSVSALISLCAGGWVAGRYAARGDHVTGRVHGFLVWGVAMILGAMLAASGARALVGGASRIVSEGMSAAGKAAPAAADLAKDALAQNSTAIQSMIDEVSEARRGANGAGVAAAQREVGMALQRLFRQGGDMNSAENRAAVVRALTQSGMSQQQANQTVERWTASMQQLRTDFEQTKAAAEAKAREAADTASKALSKAALWAFIGNLLGALAAMFGGARGAQAEYRRVAEREHYVHTGVAGHA